jgi:hypothetical protein
MKPKEIEVRITFDRHAFVKYLNGYLAACVEHDIPASEIDIDREWADAHLAQFAGTSPHPRG